MKTNWFKRTLCSILALVLVLGYFPVQTIAAESDGLCEHHTQHTKECGYSPAVEAHDCGHVHTDDCYDTVTACVHVHEDCGYVPAVEGHGCDCQPDENGEIVHTEGCGYVEALAEVLCGHVCSAESGCVTRELVCPHAHDGSCGYIAPTPEQPCTYVCQACADSRAAEDVQALMDALPTLEEIKAMSTQEQSEVYTQVQKAYDAYESLTDAQKAQIPDAENTFAVLFEYFNSLVAPAAIHSHPICGHAGCADGHSAMSWTAWNGTASIGNSNYYLTQDVTRTGYYTITGSVRICLNGHTLSTNGEAPGFRIAKGGSLVITDCQGTGMIYSDANEQNTTSSTEIGIENRGGLVLWNGTINGNWNGIWSDGGYVYIRGGSVQSRLSSAISLENGVTFSMSNGSVEGDEYGISDYDDNSSVSISGGTITGTFGALDMQSPVEINGGTFGGTLYGSQLYLSGAPKLDSVWTHSALSLQNKSGTASYTGSGFRLRSFVGNGNVAVTSVPNTGIADKITVYDGVNTGLLAGKLVASGTNLVLYTPVASGQTGNLQWRLYGDGELFLMGSGAMPDYRDASSYPWYSYRSSIRSLTVSDGVTHIGSNAFRSSNLESVSFGNASLSLGDYCFAYCDSLTSIDFGSGIIQPGTNVFHDCDALTSVHVPANVVMNGKYSGIGTGYGMFSFCRNLQTATVDCSYVGPFFFECCYAMTQATFTNKNVNFYCLEDNYGSTFRGSGSSKPMNVTVVGYLCSKANVLTQYTMPDCTLTFQQIAGDTTQHTETVLPGTATCTEDGLSEGKVCSRCGYVIVRQTNVDALGHNLTKVERQEPTCTDKGLLEHFHCSVCGKNFEDANGTTELNDTSIPAGGHSLTKVDGSEPSCTENGVKAHYHCSVCSKNFEDENSTTELNDTSIPAKGHTLTKVDGSEPSCTEDGVMLHYHCSVCGKDFKDENGTTELTDTSIPAKGHSLIKVERVEPTCTEDGVKLHYHCSVCDKDFEDANGAKEMTDTSIPTVEHEWGEWAVTTPATPEADGVETRKCTVCQQEETRPLTYTGNRLVLTGTELENQSTVWIDGVPVSIEKDDVGNSYVTLPENSSSILVTYSYNTGSGDRHTQYPTGMNVYRVEKTDSGMTVQHLPELQNLLQYSGCSIRITGNKGIRMITSVNQDTRNALTGNGLAGFKLLEYGTLLAQTSKLGNNPLVLGGANVKSNYAYKKGVADPVFKYTNGLIQYTNVLVGFTDEQCKEDIAMRPYMKLQDKNGEEFVIYGGIVYRSIGYIAYQNRNVFQPRSAAYEYVWSIIHNVYGNQYDNEYKK